MKFLRQWYTQFTTKKSQIYQLKVVLLDIKPPIWRRLLVPSDATFWEQHIAIQDSFGWEDYHLHQFFVDSAWDRNAIHIAIPNPEDNWGEGEEALDESKTKLEEFLSENHPKITYAYDFGDNWEHKIELEKILPFNDTEAYPQVIGGKRACPWENSKVFRILSEVVDQTNCSKVENLEGLEKSTFEHQEFPDNSTKNDALLPLHPI